MEMLFVIYLVLGYWAVGKTLHANRVIITSNMGTYFVKRLATAYIIGFILIPIAIVKEFVVKK